MNGTLIITVGLPASGKSTWAKEQISLNPDWLQIELDELRDELGIDRNQPHADAEKQMLQVRDERLLAALKAGKTVICSDTNLSFKAKARLQSISRQAKADLEVKDFTHVDVQECIRRDRVRKNQVGEAVIMKVYSRIRPDDPVQDEKALIIGDVHGDYNRLLCLLSKFGIRCSIDGNWSNPFGYKVIFLGDLNDPRLDDEQANIEKMSSFKCLTIAYELHQQGFSETLQSNHQSNLIDLWYGRRKNLSYGLNHTQSEMSAIGSIQVESLINWLEARPYFYSFRERGRQVTCVHAAYTPGMSQYHPNGEARSNAIYGMKTAEDTRLEWWLKDEFYLEGTIIVAGHYHQHGYFPNAVNPQAILLDGECGNTHGRLIGLTPENLQMTII